MNIRPDIATRPSERDIGPVAHHVGADLDRLLPQAVRDHGFGGDTRRCYIPADNSGNGEKRAVNGHPTAIRARFLGRWTGALAGPFADCSGKLATCCSKGSHTWTSVKVRRVRARWHQALGSQCGEERRPVLFERRGFESGHFGRLIPLADADGIGGKGQRAEFGCFAGGEGPALQREAAHRPR